MLSVAEQTSCESPVLSVAMITYKHEKFIAQAVESVLMQKTDFAVELVIGEDCSPDGTAAIVKNYASKYPGVIRARCNQTNLRMLPNSKKTLAECRGKYLAFLEGDDYWTDPRKLQRQVDFLERNPDYVGVGHDKLTVQGDQPSPKAEPDDDAFTVNEVPAREFLSMVPFANGSVVCRNIEINYPSWFEKLPFGDWSLVVLFSRHGKWGFSKSVMSAYRIHPGGIWSHSKLVSLEHEKALEFFYTSVFHDFPDLRPLLIKHVVLVQNNLLTHGACDKRKALGYLLYDKSFLLKEPMLALKVIAKLLFKPSRIGS